MHFHLPKPLHGWREFAGEVGIIVLGVLIALAFEQAVETLREHRAAAQARANVREEIATDLAFLRSREETDNCISRRLDQVGTLIKASQRSGFRAPAWVGRPRVWPMIEAKWHAATSAGRATLLSSTEQAQYGEIYHSLELIQQMELAEQTSWAHLRALEGMVAVPADAVTPLTFALTEARLDAWEIRDYVVRSEDLARQLGIKPIKTEYIGSVSVCLPVDTPRNAALARIAAASGGVDRIGEP